MLAKRGKMIIIQEIMVVFWALESIQTREKQVIKKDNKINKSAFWVHINILLISKRTAKGIQKDCLIFNGIWVKYYPFQKLLKCGRDSMS